MSRETPAPGGTTAPQAAAAGETAPAPALAPEPFAEPTRRLGGRWIALFAAAVPEVLREIDALIERRHWRISFPIEVRFAAADDLWLSTASGRETGYIAVHRFFREPHAASFEAVEEIMTAHAGRPHWGKLHTRDADSLGALYPRFDDFVALRDRLDPARLFANAYLDRVLGA